MTLKELECFGEKNITESTEISRECHNLAACIYVYIYILFVIFIIICSIYLLRNST